MRVLLTDRVWGDVEIERQIINSAGHELIDCNLKNATPDDVLWSVHNYKPDALLVCFAPIPPEAIQSGLRIIARLGIGVDNLPLDVAKALSVPVTNVPDYCIEEVSDHALALTFCLLRHVLELNNAVQSGVWSANGIVLRRIAELTVGVIGCGRIGTAAARKFKGVGCHVIAYDPALDSHPTVEMTSLDLLLADSDVVSLHVPLSSGTQHIVDAEFIAKMKPGAFLVNTSRGPLVDTEALADALDRGDIAGAALDTVEGEPAVPRRLAGRSNVILTPHVAFASVEAVRDLRRRAAEEVVRALADEPLQNRVA